MAWERDIKVIVTDPDDNETIEYQCRGIRDARAYITCWPASWTPRIAVDGQVVA